MNKIRKSIMIGGNRRKIPLNEGWLFHKGGFPQLEGLGEKTEYREVALPHD